MTSSDKSLNVTELYLYVKSTTTAVCAASNTEKHAPPQSGCGPKQQHRPWTALRADTQQPHHLSVKGATPLMLTSLHSPCSDSLLEELQKKVLLIV